MRIFDLSANSVSMPREERDTYLDEADQFYANPEHFVQTHLGGAGHCWPSHLITFQALALDATFKQKGYKICDRFFNTHWIDDPRRVGDVLVWCKT